MEQTVIYFLGVSCVLFLSFAPVDCQWGFGLGKGAGWDLLWSNMGDLDKYDLNKNSKESTTNVIPKRHSTQDRTSLQTRYGGFIQSADSSDESDDSSSEEIAVGTGGNIYNSYLENEQNRNLNYNNGLQSQLAGGKYSSEGEELVNNGDAGTGSRTETGSNGQYNNDDSHVQSGSANSAWYGNGRNGEGSERDMQNKQGMTYDKRSPHTQTSQQGQLDQGVHQNQQGQHRGQGQSGQRRYRSWADYRRQHSRNNQGADYEREDVPPTSNGAQGQGQGADYGGIEPEDRTTPAAVSNAHAKPTGQEYEAEDVTTNAPSGSGTNGRVTFRGSTTQEYEIENSKTSTAAPKVSKKTVNTWESGMTSTGQKPQQPGQDGRAQNNNFRGSWVNIGQKPYQSKGGNVADRNGWTAYASSVEGTGPGNGIRPQQSRVDATPNEKQSNSNQGQTKTGSSGTGTVNVRQTFPGMGSSSVQHGNTGNTQTGVGTDNKPQPMPSANVQVSAWLDTAPNNKKNPSKPMMSSFNGQQPKQHSSFRPVIHSEHNPRAVRPTFPSGRNPAAVRSSHQNNPMATPQSSNGQRSAPLHPSFPNTRNPPSRVSASPTRRQQQPRRPAQSSRRTPEQTAGKLPRKNGSSNNIPLSHQDGWVHPPPVSQDQAPTQPTLSKPSRKNGSANIPLSHQDGWVHPPPVSQDQAPTQPTLSKPSRKNGSSNNIPLSHQDGWVHPAPVRQDQAPTQPTLSKPSRENGSSNNIPLSHQDGWVHPPPVSQDPAPKQPTRDMNTNPKQKAAWRAVQRNNVPRPSYPVQPNRNPFKGQDSKKKSWNGKSLNEPHNNQPRQSTRVINPTNNVQPTWEVIPGSPKHNQLDPKVQEQLPTPESVAPNRSQSWSIPKQDLTGRHPNQRNNVKKPSDSIPHQGEQPVFRDINSAQPSKQVRNGRRVYPNDNSLLGGDILRQRPVVGGHVTEKPVVGATKVSKRPLDTDTGHVTIAMKLDVSDASVPNLKVNDWGNGNHRGDFVYKPKPTKAPQGHTPKGSRKTNWINIQDPTRTNPDNPRNREMETSTFSVINPNSQTSHTGPAVIRPTKNNKRPWNQNISLQPLIKQAPGRGNDPYLNKIKNLIDQQQPSKVIKHFIEATTENGLGVSGYHGNNGLITNIDNTLSSDSPQLINLLRDIDRANQRSGPGQQQTGVPKNDVIAKMSSTAVLGKYPYTIDMAPGQGSIVDGVDAEVLLNSNANIHGIINSKNHETYNPSTRNSVLERPKLESTKNRTPYTGFHRAATGNDVNVGALSMAVKRVNGEARPVAEAELGRLKNGNSGQGSSKNVRNIPKNRPTNIKNISNRENPKHINNTINTSVIPTPEASTPNQWSEYNPKPKGVNTKSQSNMPTRQQSGTSTVAEAKAGKQTMPGPVGHQTTPGTHGQYQTVPGAHRGRQGGGGTPLRGAFGGGGAWKTSARNEARELVLEKEGHWNSVNITTIGKKSNMCPVYDVTYQENAVILSTGHNSCKIVITWHPRPRSRQVEQQTPFGVRRHFVTRMKYVPVVTYVNAR